MTLRKVRPLRGQGVGGGRWNGRKVMAAPGESRLKDKVKAALQEIDKSIQEVIK